MRKSMQDKASADISTSAQKCTRTPCDYARRGQVHTTGEELHRVGWDTYYKPGDIDTIRWRVLAVAAEGCEWEVRLFTPGLERFQGFDMSTEELDRLQSALRKAQRCADDANRREDGDYITTLSKRIFELEDSAR